MDPAEVRQAFVDYLALKPVAHQASKTYDLVRFMVRADKQISSEERLILDELATISLRMQEKILRVIEYGEIQRVGGSETLQVDVRIVGSTNADLRQLAAAGTFRQDLLDRRRAEARMQVPGALPQTGNRLALRREDHHAEAPEQEGHHPAHREHVPGELEEGHIDAGDFFVEAEGDGAAGGAVFTLLGPPLPWLLGALCATAGASVAGLRLGLDQRLRAVALVGSTSARIGTFLVWISSAIRPSSVFMPVAVMKTSPTLAASSIFMTV